MKRMSADQLAKYLEVYFEDKDLSLISTKKEINELALEAGHAVRALWPDIQFDDLTGGFAEFVRRSCPLVRVKIRKTLQ